MQSQVRLTPLVACLLFGAGITPVPALAQQAPVPAKATQPTAPTLLPALAGPLSANSEPFAVDAGPQGKVYVTGIVSGFAQFQDHAATGDSKSLSDVSNAQVFINKSDGLFQFFLQAGTYSLPAVGVPYLRSSDATRAYYGNVPQGYVKLAPTGNFSVMAGKLPTLIGAEYTFSFENMNVQRGLLWNQENAVARGIQANYTVGPVAFAVSANDGFYSKKYSWVTGSATWTIDDANTVALIAGGNTKGTDIATSATPLLQNNERIVNVIYTHTDGPWTLQPYLQYTNVPAIDRLSTPSASTIGGALLVGYNFGSASDSWKLAGLSLPVRVEYLSSTGDANLLYGAGSKAWSVTVTPTYQYKRFFARGEFAYVGTRKTTAGLAFGPDGNASAQSRGVLEVGLLF